jgi:6-phosphogluconolactonase
VRFATGCYTGQGKGTGVTEWTLDPQNGAVQLVRTTPVSSPSWVAPHEGEIWALTEDGAPHAKITRVRDGQIRGTFELAIGQGCCHFSVVKGTLCAASYGGGKAQVGSHVFAFAGRGPVSGRQSSSHIHQALPLCGGTAVLFTDLGGDELIQVDLASGEITGRLKLPAGTGPRHALQVSEAELLVLGEMDGAVHRVRLEPTGPKEVLATAVAFPDLQAPGVAASAIKHAPEAGFVVVAERAKHRLRWVRSADLEMGKVVNLTGEGPRDFSFSPDGKWLVVACQKSNELLVYTGGGEFLHHVPTGAPTCVAFLD